MASPCGSFSLQSTGPRHASLISWAHRLSSSGAWPWSTEAWQVESSQTQDLTCIPCIDRWILIHGATREVTVWSIFKVLITCVTTLLMFSCFSFFWPLGMLDLRSPTKHWTHPPCIVRRSLNLWTTSPESFCATVLGATLAVMKQKQEIR